ncbi:MAG TPA: DNA repair protein RecO [archaeon]|nr:DNA repair protein RecO [archaeon]
MDPVRQSAIVLGGVDYSDSSRVVWILTPEFGRQSLMVKGAHRAKSKFLGSLETFNLVRVIYRKTGRGTLYTLREVDVEDHFGGIRKSLEAFWAASRAVELVKAVSSEDQESEDLFELLKSFLTFANNCGEKIELLKPLLAAFRWRLVSLFGMAPQLVECVRCRSKLTRRERYSFLLVEGGVLCQECDSSAPNPGSSRSAGLSYQAMRFVYRSSRSFPSSPDDTVSLSPADFRELESLSQRYLTYHLGDNPAFNTDKMAWPLAEGKNSGG